MYVAIVFTDSTLCQIHEVHGLFKTYDGAAKWALDKYPAPFAVIVKWLEGVI